MDLNICYSNTLPQQRSPQLPPQLEEKDDELVLQDCLEPFKSKDYIMEPEIFTSVKRLMSNTEFSSFSRNTQLSFRMLSYSIYALFYTRFFEAGGETESLIDLLSDNYIGTAQSANLLANWLIVTGDHLQELTSAAGCSKKDCLLFYLL
jgi:negative elongation factor C/D